MPTDRWQRLEGLFNEALEQPAPVRAGFVADRCGADSSLRDEIASLLTAAEHSSEFLAAPALEVFAQQISREGWSVQVGDRIGSYVVERRLGAGGMGEVWRARDERLGRDVAIKLLLPHPSNTGARVHALQREARAGGTLNHTNVVTVYDIGDHAGAPYLVTECLEGESLRARLGAGALALDTALDVALQVARGLEAAHARGIVHRDLKPENIFLALDGRVKILDFGLATLHDAAAQAASPSAELSTDTMRSLVAGTAGYMAPEQLSGEPVDRRADIFALGAVLHEMLTGRGPFKRDNTLATLDAVLTLDPPDLSEVKPELPKSVSQIARRCLAKSRDDRPAAAAEVVSALESIVRARNLSARSGPQAWLRQPLVIVCAVVVILGAAASVWRWHTVAERVRWARTVATPEIQRLLNQDHTVEAFLLAREALEALPSDPELRQLLNDASTAAVVTTEPAGAEVALAPYGTPATTWSVLGRTPLNGVRMPGSLCQFRVSKPGYQTIQVSGSPHLLFYRLDVPEAVPAGMVRVVGGPDPVRLGLVAEVDDYWIDRFEVTNRQFKEFVDRGGYSQPGYWREVFREGRRSLAWKEAVGRFLDASGQPGPATWNSGTYADGRAEFPVEGVSWYEAAAYAVFAGKSLPTIHHWYRAAGLGRYGDILLVSNFNSKGAARVGSHDGLGPFGTYDMAGNVKEWSWTETNERRFLLGGAWNDTLDSFADYDARNPFERAPGYGIRLVKYIRPLPPAAAAPVRIEALVRDVRKQRPVSDDIFDVYRRQFAYDHTPLNAVVEATEESDAWVKHTIAVDAAYGGERMRVHLFLPRNGAPPYQTVAYFPAGGAFHVRESRQASIRYGEFIIHSGRALLFPVYKGTYERTTFEQRGPFGERERQIAWSRDLGRALDYVETRPDVDRTRLAFYGVSGGADAGVILTALEARLKASVLQGTGLGEVVEPEVDLLNYAPRVRMPTLMLNGRYDYENPFTTSQNPLFELLGSPAADKRHVVLDSGHAVPVDPAAHEVLAWLDRYLGPVAQPSH